MILTPSNKGDLGKIIVATGFEWLPKVQKIAQSGHTVPITHVTQDMHPKRLYQSTRLSQYCL